MSTTLSLQFKKPWKDSPTRANLISLTILLAIITFFVILYGRMVYRLPIFGDAATHAYLSNQMMQHGVFGISNTAYPPLYHLLGAFLMKIGGETGFKTLTVIGLVVLAFSVYFLALVLFQKHWIGLLSAFLVLASPKTISYSARMYMEIFLSGFVILTFALFAKFLLTSRRAYLIASIIFLGLSAWIKQQALVVLLPAMLIVYIGMLAYGRLRHRQALRDTFTGKGLLVFVLMTVLLLAFPIIWQVRVSGTFLPDSDLTSWANRAAARVVGYQAPKPPSWVESWSPRLTEIETQYGLLAGDRASQRWTRPWDVFLKEQSFENIHSVYNASFFSSSPYLSGIWMVLVIIGLLLFFISYDRKVAIFLIVFLLLNYVSFARNTDQMRYHLFIAFMLVPLALYAVDRFAHIFPSAWYGRAAITLLVTVVAVSSVITAAVYPQKMKGFAKTQAYSPSVGGIASVKEASLWLRDNSDVDDTVLAMPATEFDYYVGRELTALDWRWYFLSDAEKEEILRDASTDYVVIMDSVLRKNQSWNHKGYVPQSFDDFLLANYPVVFNTAKGDIQIFKIGGVWGNP